MARRSLAHNFQAVWYGAAIIWTGQPLAYPVVQKSGAAALYAGAVEGVGDLVSEAQQEIGAKTPAESHAEGSTPRA